MGEPYYQRILTSISYFGIGVLALGSLLDTVSNSISLITPSITYRGSAVIVSFWLVAELLIKKYPLLWVVSPSQKILVKRIGLKPRLIIVGTIAVLWIPVIPNASGWVLKGNLDKHEGIKTNASPAAKSIIVLIADFDGPDPQAYGVAQIIFDQLKDATSKYPEVIIRRLNQSFDTSETAKAKGIENQAAVVLWGSYLVNQLRARVTIHFDVLHDTLDLPLRQKKEVLNVATIDLQGFTIQEQLSKEMTYLTLLTLGLVRFEANDIDESITRFSAALSQINVPNQIINPGHLYLYRGTAYLLKHELKLALADFNKSLTFNQDSDAYGARGLVYLSDNQVQSAIRDFTTSIRLDSNHVKSYINRGLAYYTKGDLTEALADFDKALHLDSSKISAYTNRGAVYLFKGELGSAIADYSKAISLDPTNGSHYINRGMTYVLKEEFDLAFADLNKAITLNDYPASAYLHRGNAYYQLGNLELALADLNVAIMAETINSEIINSETYHLRGRIYSDKGDYERAIKDYEQAIKLSPLNEEIYISRGAAYLDKGELDQALTNFGRAIELNPRNDQAYNNRGVIHFKRDDFDSAIRDFNRAITINPKFGEALVNRANAFNGKQDFKRAILDSNKAISLDPDDPEPYLARGSAYLRRGEFGRAVADLDHLIMVQPNDALAHINRGSAYLGMNKFDQAMADYNKGVVLDPNLAFMASMGIGNTYRAKGDFEQALIQYGQAINLQPTEPIGYYNYGVACLEKGEGGRATSYLQKALSLSTNPQLTLDIKQKMLEVERSVRSNRHPKVGQ